MDEIYREKLSSRLQCTKFTDPPFEYDKQDFTSFLKIFYKDIAKNQQLGLVKMAKLLIDEILKTPTLVLALIYFSRQDEGSATFINWYQTLDLKEIKLTDVSIAKNIIKLLDMEKAITSLEQL